MALTVVLAALIAVFTAWAAYEAGLGYRESPAYAEPDPSVVMVGALPVDTRDPSSSRKKALYCVHGFPATPEEFRRLAPEAMARGWDIVAPLLPGCGTKPGDIAPYGFEAWYAAARAGWIAIKAERPDACIAGLSVGGTIALRLAQEFAEDPVLAPSAVMTMGSPIVMNALLRRGMVIHPLLYCARLFGRLVPSLGAGLPDPDRPDRDGDGSWIGYVGFFAPQSYSMKIAFRKVERDLPRLRAPLFVAHCREDTIVDVRNAFIIAREAGSKRVQAWFPSMKEHAHARHNLFLYDSIRSETLKRALDFFEEELRVASRAQY